VVCLGVTHCGARSTPLHQENDIFYLDKLVVTDQNVECSKPDAIGRIKLALPTEVGRRLTKNLGKVEREGKRNMKTQH